MERRRYHSAVSGLWLRSLGEQRQRLEKALCGMESGAAENARAELYREILHQMREMGETS